jgi:hypothetical protein
VPLTGRDGSTPFSRTRKPPAIGGFRFEGRYRALPRGCGSGALPAHDKDSLVVRVERGLIESGASPRLAACLTKDLDDVLTERDAKAAYDDLSSDPEASEPSLNSVSLLPPHVKAGLKEQVGHCRSALVSSGAYTATEFDHMLKRVGRRAYRWHPNFLTR